MSTQGITYELALALKNAGFPQQGEGRWFNIDGKTYQVGQVVVNLTGKELDIYSPTLSELIEACGIKFIKLVRNVSSWEAVGFDVDSGRGSTPEEAVARLWLALNAKK